jgi:hypothetical protein
MDKFTTHQHTKKQVPQQPPVPSYLALMEKRKGMDASLHPTVVSHCSAKNVFKNQPEILELIFKEGQTKARRPATMGEDVNFSSLIMPE